MSDELKDKELQILIDENKGYSINDDLEADKAIERIIRAEESIERLETLLKQKIDELKAKFDHQKSMFQAKIEFYKFNLATYMATLDPKVLRYTKSGSKIYDLSSGKITLSQKQNWIYDKENPAFINWLDDNGLNAYIVTKESVNWAELKSELEVTDEGIVNKSTGEIIPKEIVDCNITTEVKIGK